MKSRLQHYLTVLLGDVVPFVAVGALAAIGVLMAVSDRGASPTELGAQLWPLALAAAAAGAASCAVVEIAKRLLGLRGLYQRRQLTQWFRRRGGRDGLLDLEHLTLGAFTRGWGGGHVVRRFYELPIETIVAQFATAADVAMLDRERHLSLLVSLDREVLDSIDLEVLDEESRNEYPSAVVEDSRDIRAAHAVRASIDAMQIEVGEGWRRYLRSTAVWVSGLVGLSIAIVLHPDNANLGLVVLSGLFIGGPLAWTLRDLAAVIERLRN